MKAMILAAGFGRRMGALTKVTPKPLLKIQDKALVEHALSYCKTSGITEVVINVHYHAEQIMSFLGNGERYGMQIEYSDERECLLGTGGGILKALPLLGDQPFVLLSSDIVTDFSLAQLPVLKGDEQAHLVLVNNPEHHPEGDFGLDGRFVIADGMRFTYGNIAVLSPELFECKSVREVDFASIIEKAIMKKRVTGEFYNGYWFNVGTPDVLESLNVRAGKPMLGGCPKKR